LDEGNVASTFDDARTSIRTCVADNELVQDAKGWRYRLIAPARRGQAVIIIFATTASSTGNAVGMDIELLGKLGALRRP
jgi:hypothetical protein